MKVNAASIREGMTKRWAEPEWAIMWEVGEGTGALSGRYADAVMMSLWPSRGLELHGVEIKTSRSDWKREAADPSKAEAIAKYCDRWWIHTSPGVVDDISDIPPAWGLREFDGKKWTTRKEAEKTEAAPVTRPFLAAMLRRSDGLFKKMLRQANEQSEQKVQDQLEKNRIRYQEDVKAGIERATRNMDEVKKNYQAFCEAFGLDNKWIDYAHLGKAAKALMELSSGYGSMPDRLRRMADELEAITKFSKGDAQPIMELMTTAP